MNQKRNLALHSFVSHYVLVCCCVVSPYAKGIRLGFMQTFNALNYSTLRHLLPTLPFPKLYRLLLPIQKKPLMEKA